MSYGTARSVRIKLSLVLVIFVIGLGVYVSYSVYTSNQRPSVIVSETISYPLGAYAGLIGYSTLSLLIFLTVTSYSPIVTGDEVTIEAFGTASTAFMENVSFVFVSFPESQPYSNSVIALGNGYGIELYPNSTAPSYNLEVRPGDYLNATEYDFGEYVQGAPVDLAFQQVGSYSPVLTIVFKNNTQPVQQTYQGLAINIESSSVLQDLIFNHLNIVLSFALVGFGLVEALKITYEVYKGK